MGKNSKSRSSGPAGLLLLALVVLVTAQIQPALCADKKGTASRKSPLVVMKQAEIKGKVFLLSDKSDEEATVIKKMNIRVYTSDAKKCVYKTYTDKDGNYTLPNLDVGVYRMMVGLLELALRVEDPEKIQANVQSIPKTITVFIPKELEDFSAE